MLAVEESKSTIMCPLQLCVGNCFFREKCEYSHSEETKAPQAKPKKPLKVGNNVFTPQLSAVSFIPAETAQDLANNNQSKNLKATAQEFVPSGTNQFVNFEENKVQYPGYLDEQEEFLDEYDPFGDKFNEYDQMYQEGIEEDVDYFHNNSKNCDCCQGYINKCMGAICKSLGYCHCYATEIEEQEYNYINPK